MEWSFVFFLNSVLLGVGLAMDAFSVSMANGLHDPKMTKSTMGKIAGTFGIFQAAMPMIGWVCVHTIVELFASFERFIPWIALALLGYIGGKMLADGIRHGDSYAAIGKAVGRSEKCVRSKVYNDYLTENADKVREMLGDGAWGHGAPEMDVRHGFYISRTRHQVRRDLSALATVLRKRMNDLGYDPYWQRFMCMNWDDIGGCSAGCTDCDSCTAFRRIQPQYCARCGGTFYERKENRFCAACRTARKKQAQRHWCRVNGMSRR